MMNFLGEEVTDLFLPDLSLSDLVGEDLSVIGLGLTEDIDTSAFESGGPELTVNGILKAVQGLPVPDLISSIRIDTEASLQTIYSAFPNLASVSFNRDALFEEVNHLLNSPMKTGSDKLFYMLDSLLGNDLDKLAKVGDNHLLGLDEDDLLEGGPGNDFIDGGSGRDVAVYSGNVDEYDFSLSDDFKTVTVEHVRGSQLDGKDTLERVEVGQFADREVSLAGADIVFVIDATGSMDNDIALIKTQAAQMISETARSVPLTRFALVTYKNPGETTTQAAFTAVPEKIVAAIEELRGSGGGDFQEGVNSGLLHALEEQQGLGDWRPDPTPRSIILIGDGPAEDTQMRSQVVSEAISPTVEFSSETFGLPPGEVIEAPALPVRVFPVIVGSVASTIDDFTEIADATGGKAFYARTPSGVVEAIAAALEEAVTPAVGKALIGTDKQDTLTGTDADDTFIGLDKRDVITSGGGRDRFVYVGYNDGRDIITDFEVGSDQIVLTELLKNIGFEGIDPISAGVVEFRSHGAETIVRIDPDGIAGDDPGRVLVSVLGVSIDVLSNASNFVL